MTVASTEPIWQRAECGAYDADLPAFEALAAETDGAILDLGAGVGRVALQLAGLGHEIVALDQDPDLLASLGERAASRGLEIQTVAADVAAFDLTPREFGLILAPMQLLQMTGGEGRRSALARCAAHLAPHGRLAAAIVDGALPDATPESALLPDVLERDGWVYSSLPLSVRSEDGQMVVERLRQAVSPGGALTEGRVEERLEILSCDELEREAAPGGLRPVRRIELPDTDQHVGSTIVVLEAAHA